MNSFIDREKPMKGEAAYRNVGIVRTRCARNSMLSEKCSVHSFRFSSVRRSRATRTTTGRTLFAISSVFSAAMTDCCSCKTEDTEGARAHGVGD